MPATPALPEEISPEELKSALMKQAVVLLDCREPDEHALCRIEGARLLPLATWASAYPGQFPAADTPLVVYCHHGFRSLQATRFLRQHGHVLARSLAGGIDAWSRAIDPAVPLY
jgi:rhodanese-related sulfurtransferase